MTVIRIKSLCPSIKCGIFAHEYIKITRKKILYINPNGNGETGGMFRVKGGAAVLAPTENSICVYVCTFSE